jgi:putative peptide zinc metalloprotease protein
VDGQSDASTQELTRLRLKLEDDVIFTPHQYGEDTYYHVELPTRSKFFRIGLPEYTFISLLDGNTTVAEALSLTARALGPDAFSERDAAAICAWLVERGLAQPCHISQTARLYGAADRERKRSLAGRLNPFWLKFPIASPDRLLERLVPFVGWIYSRPAMLAGLALCGTAVATVATNWDELFASSVAVFSPANWIWLFVAWVLVKAIHEIGHGVACKRHGGEVRELGVILILFVPVPYVDVTSSWRFRSKWQRIHTAAGGMYVELLVAAVAALIWSRTESAVACHLLYSMMLMSSAMTLLFNANPLMRFDGYYILADLLEIPNLYSSGSRYLAGLAGRILLGVPGASKLGWRWKDVLVRLYGVSAFCWRILVCASLAIAASVLFHGAGLALAALGLTAWLVPPALRASRTVIRQYQANPWTVVRVGAVVMLLATVGTTLVCLPWPGACTAPGIIEYRDSVVVRAQSPGFVTAIHVQDGQLVERGDLLMEMTNDQLDAECRDLVAALDQSEARRRIHLEKHEQAAVQVELENQRALKKRLAERRRQFEGLTLHSPVSGRVMARNLDMLLMTYLEEGAEVLAVGDDTHKQLRVSIAQEDNALFQAQLGEPVKLRLRSTGMSEGQLSRVIPRASKTPPHLALCAPLGGPLAVTNQLSQESDDSYEFVLPRFTGIVELPQHLCASHQAGEFGYATIQAAQSKTITQVVSRRVSQWLENKLAEARRSDGTD